LQQGDITNAERFSNEKGWERVTKGILRLIQQQNSLLWLGLSKFNGKRSSPMSTTTCFRFYRR
jgi:hypothetical protein